MAYKSNTKVRSSTDTIAIHCSATRPSQNIDAATIDRWHRANGWVCIGYHKVIKRDGTIEEGRDINVVGAHVSGHNHNSIGICMVGGVSEKDVNVPENNFTEAQFKSLKALLKDLKLVWPKAKIQGHRDYPNVKKACPSFGVSEWLQSNNLS